jgi:predicted nucleic acid-binding protein
MAQALFFLEVKDHEVRNVELNRNNLTIRTGYNFQVVPVEVIGEPDYSLIIQMNRRWDHIQDLLMTVPEQPVVIEIRVQVVSVIFQY